MGNMMSVHRETTHLVYAGIRCHARHDLRRNKPAMSAVFVKHVRVAPILCFV